MKNKTVQNTNPSVEQPDCAGKDGRGFSQLLGGNESLLVVEDEAPVRLLAVHILSELGYRVTEAASGAEALEIWKQKDGQFDLLFSDMALFGGISGLQLGEELAKKRPGLPIIITSGYGADFLDGLAGGVHVTYLGKPYAFAELATTIRSCLDSATVHPELDGTVSLFVPIVD